MAIEEEKKDIEREINRARDGMSVHIDELDERLRAQLDFKAFATKNAPQIVVGGAVLGFLAGFGFPKALRRAIILGVPLAVAAVKLKKSLGSHDNYDGDAPAPDYVV